MKSATPTGRSESTSRSQVALEAADWLIRLTDSEFDPDEPYPDPIERQRVFFEWLQDSPERARVFYEVLEVEHRARRLDRNRVINIERLLTATPNNVISIEYHEERRSNFDRPAPSALDHRTQERLQSTFSSRLRPAWIVSATAAAGIAVMTIGLLLSPQRVATSTVYYSTVGGERQTITLEDGSVVILNAASRIAVTYDHYTRVVRLLTGEAFFDVRHDVSRPFRVIADDLFLEDLGTQFDVDRRATTTRVTVSNGSVQLACGCVSGQSSSSVPESSGRIGNFLAHASTAMTLVAGDQINVTYKNGVIRHVTLTQRELANVISWRNGEMWFVGEPLSIVVDKLNAYSSQRIVVADPSIADKQINGTCSTLKAASCAKILASASDIQVLPPDSDDDSTIRLVGYPAR